MYILNIKIRPRVIEIRIRIKRVGGTCFVHEFNHLCIFGRAWFYFDIQNVWFSYNVYYIDFQNFLYIICFICICHCTRMNLRAMILQGSAGRICHLENVKSYFSYLQQCKKIIKMFTLKAYFSWIRSQLKHTRSQITSNLYVSNWKSSYDIMLFMCQSRQYHFT